MSFLTVTKLNSFSEYYCFEIFLNYNVAVIKITNFPNNILFNKEFFNNCPIICQKQG